MSTASQLYVERDGIENMMCLSFWLWVLPLNTVFSSFINFSKIFVIFFSFQFNRILFCMCTTFSLSIHDVRDIGVLPIS